MMEETFGNVEDVVKSGGIRVYRSVKCPEPGLSKGGCAASLPDCRADKPLGNGMNAVIQYFSVRTRQFACFVLLPILSESGGVYNA